MYSTLHIVYNILYIIYYQTKEIKNFIHILKKLDFIYTRIHKKL